MKSKDSHSTYSFNGDLGRKGGSMAPQEPPLDPSLLSTADNIGGTKVSATRRFDCTLKPFRKLIFFGRKEKK